MKSLKWNQVNAWRLAQHGLSPRLEHPDFIEAVTRTGGIQAQVMSAAEQAIWARVDKLAQQDVQSALWQERTLVKTWAMRATLHLIAARDYPLYVAARSLYDHRNWIGYFEYYGVHPELYETYLSAAPQVLSDSPITREQFASAIARHTGSPELHGLILGKGWGTPLKPLAWRGDLCFGPNQGRNVTFVHPKRWLGTWQPVEPYPALQEMARRYLRAYGPATPIDFALWWGMRTTPARKLFQSLSEELETVEIEGRQAHALRNTLERMENMELKGTVNLLPLFDAYVLGLGHGREVEPILSQKFKRQVYRPQGWISAVVLVDGFMKGIWEYTTRSSYILLKIRLFSSPPNPVRKGIEAEAERLSIFLNTKINLTYEKNE